MSLDLLGNIEQHVDLALVRLSSHQPFHDTPHPAGSLATGRALAAALVLEEVGQSRNRLNDVRRLVHDDHGSRAERRFQFAHAFKIYRGVEHVLVLHHWARGPTRYNREQIVPAATYAIAVLFHDFAEGDAHRIFNHAGRVYVADQHEQLGADIV